MLDLAAPQRLTIVVAPPGYGKTVLLSQWAAAHPRRRVRWLAIDPAANEPAILVRDLRAALDHGGRGPDDQRARRRELVDAEGSPSPLLTLLPELDSLPPTTLVLDDFHELTDPALLEDLATLIEHAPRTLHVVVATRVDPPLPYHRLRLSDLLVELRQEDLAFTTEEAAELIRRVSGRDLDPSHVEALVGRTEGWAAGLQLAALSLRTASDVEEFVQTFAGDERHVADYLTERVLREAPDPIRRFLLETSVLDRLCGSLCDAVTGHPGGQAMLEQLERMSMFITKLDARRRWFRYHPLFQALLRHHLRDRDPTLEHQLLHRAADWHLARDDLAAGVSYLAAAGAWQEVLDAASVHGRGMLARGDVATVASWIESVPRTVTDGRPEILLLQAGALALGGNPAKAVQILDIVDADAAASAAHRLVADLLRSYCALQRDDPSLAVRAAERALAAIGRVGEEELPDVLGLTHSRAEIATAARIIGGTALLYQGRVHEGREVLDEIRDDDLQAADALWQIACLGSRALMEAWSGHLTAAERLGTRGLVIAREIGVEDGPLTTEALLALVAVCLERNDPQRARALLDEAARRSIPDRRVITTALFAIEYARLALAEGEPADGLMILASRRAGEHASLPDAIVARRRAVEARLLMMAGDLDGAARALDLASEGSLDAVTAAMQLALERGDLVGARDLLERWPSEPEPRTVLERTLWLAIVDDLAGRQEAARAGVAVVVAEAEPEHHLGLFREYHAQGLARSLYRTAPTAFLRTIVDQPALATRVRPVKELVEQLTDREFMVLTLLPSRLSNVEIAGALGVSLNTVKTHLKHIYRKLAVTDRSEAVAEAERLGLL